VTLPLIVPALLAGLIFSFTRHMTSLSAIIFLVTRAGALSPPRSSASGSRAG
jgi:ABC-type Fe3+ transport system permease subunit